MDEICGIVTDEVGTSAFRGSPPQFIFHLSSTGVTLLTPNEESRSLGKSVIHNLCAGH